jgi:hypothetical protein
MKSGAAEVLNVGNETAASHNRAGRVRLVKLVRPDGTVRDESIEKVQEKFVEQRLLASEIAESIKCLGCKERVGHPRTTTGKIGRGPRYCDGCVGEYVREKNREKNRKWREANPEKARERDRKWREANLEKERERTRKRREANPEKARERARKRYEANPEKARERDRKYREANLEKARERARKNYEANLEKNRERARKYQERKRAEKDALAKATKP